MPPGVAAGGLKAFAARHRQTPSLVIADWIRKAEIQEAIARGRKDFEARDVVGHEDAKAVRRMERAPIQASDLAQD